MRISTADTIRGTSTCVVAGVMTILMPASELPHKFGYYAAVAAFLLGLRFGLRAIGMFFICCVAIGIAEPAVACCRTDCGRRVPGSSGPQRRRLLLGESGVYAGPSDYRPRRASVRTRLRLRLLWTLAAPDNPGRPGYPP